MKLLALASVVASASAFTAPVMTFAVGKKTAPQKAAATKPVLKSAPTKAAAKATPPKAAAATKAVAAKPAPKVAAKPAVKAVVKAAPKPAPKPVVKAAPKPAPKPVVKAVVKAAPKPAPKPKPVVKKIVSSGSTVASAAIPGEFVPSILDGSLVGDAGFDPCFLSTKADGMAAYFNGLFQGKTNLDGLTWYRESELIHGRICMAAVLGFIAPGFGTISGNEWTGVEAYASTNPLEAISTVPSAAFFQIFAFMSILEFRRINNIAEAGDSYQVGDFQKWGQGEGRWNPFNLNYTPEEYAEKQLQELKHGRLAMIGLLGLIFQANNSGISVVDQLSTAFVIPDYVGKAGYYFPEGI